MITDPNSTSKTNNLICGKLMYINGEYMIYSKNYTNQQTHSNTNIKSY